MNQLERERVARLAEQAMLNGRHGNGWLDVADAVLADQATQILARIVPENTNADALWNMMLRKLVAGLHA